MKTVWILERNPELAELIAAALRRWGYDVDGRGDVGLVICGSRADLLRLRELGLRAPALLLSAEEVDGLGEVGRLPKPFDLDELRWETALRLDPPRATGGEVRRPLRASQGPEA